jgi:hypothetical protein
MVSGNTGGIFFSCGERTKQASWLDFNAGRSFLFGALLSRSDLSKMVSWAHGDMINESHPMEVSQLLYF